MLSITNLLCPPFQNQRAPLSRADSLKSTSSNAGRQVDMKFRVSSKFIRKQVILSFNSAKHLSNFPARTWLEVALFHTKKTKHFLGVLFPPSLLPAALGLFVIQL